MLTNEDVQEIVRILDASPYGELRLETPRFTLTLRRGAHGGWTQERHTLAGPGRIPADENSSAEAGPAPPQVEAARAEQSGSAPAAAVVEGLVAIQTPLPGTFYRAPRPGAAPFVEVGATVEEDTVIGIIETMKLMNSARAGARGEIVEICTANGELVEMGHVLMRLRPEGM